MKQRVVGQYEMGHNCVQISLREGTGGEFYLIPQKGRVASIKLGADNDWMHVVNAFLHEAMELEFERMSCRYEHGGYVGRDMSDFLFVASHPQFTEIVARVAELTATALPDVAKTWKQWRKEGK